MMKTNFIGLEYLMHRRVRQVGREYFLNNYRI